MGQTLATSNSPSGFFAMTDMNATDYKTLKRNANHQKGSNTLNNRSSSISIVRMEREFSPKKRRGSIEAAMAAEQLIMDLTENDQDFNEEIKTQLENESLPGTCKSQYALKFRMKSDANNANFMIESEKNPLAVKTKTKGRFPREYKTNAGSWINDREWKNKANPSLAQDDKRMEASDNAMLQKRKKQKLLQNIALEEQYKIVVKKPKF